jgi:hypothetical protein
MKALLVSLFVAGLMLFAAVAAQASDQTLRTTIRQQERQYKPDVKAFDKSVAKAKTVADLMASKQPAQQLATDVGAYANAVSAQQADTPKVQRGQKLFEKSLSELAAGLNNWVGALNQLQQNQSSATVKKTLKTSLKEIARGDLNSARAAKLIGVKI